LTPDKLSQTGRRELRHLLRSYDLELSAVGCPLRRGLDAAENQQPRIEYVKKVMSLSFDLGPRVVTVHAARVPEDAEQRSEATRARRLSESLTELAAHGDRTGVVLAWTTGSETGAALRDYLQRFDTASLGVNFDPASLFLSGFDPLESLRALRGLVRHALAKDARISGASRLARDVALGHGDLDWLQVLGVLEEVEYRGWLMVDRETSVDRSGDLARGVDFLRRLGA
jgi:sugar phosphate isomerase/epimerase